MGVLLPNVNATVYPPICMFGMRRSPAMLNFTSGVDAMQNKPAEFPHPDHPHFQGVRGQGEIGRLDHPVR